MRDIVYIYTDIEGNFIAWKATTGILEIKAKRMCVRYLKYVASGSTMVRLI